MDDLLQDLRARDAATASAQSPRCKQSSDAILLDTTNMSIDEAVRRRCLAALGATATQVRH